MTHEQYFGIAKLALALRNWLCEIFALRIWHCEIFALRNFAKLLAMGLRNAQWPAATVPLLLHPAASHPVSTASHFLHFSFDFPLILGFVDG